MRRILNSTDFHIVWLLALLAPGVALLSARGVAISFWLVASLACIPQGIILTKTIGRASPAGDRRRYFLANELLTAAFCAASLAGTAFLREVIGPQK